MLTGRAKDNLRLRGEPKYESLEIGFIRLTESMEVLGVSGDWLKVKHGDQEGFVMRKFVLISDEDLASLGPSAIERAAAEPASEPPAMEEEAPKPKPKPKTKRPSVKSSQK
jgi:hypothetical protein